MFGGGRVGAGVGARMGSSSTSARLARAQARNAKLGRRTVKPSPIKTMGRVKRK